MTNNIKPDWSDRELKEYFTFATGMKSDSPDVIYYGELITLLNPNIVRASIENIPKHTDEKPSMTKTEIDGISNLLESDLTLMANRYQIKQVKPPTEE